MTTQAIPATNGHSSHEVSSDVGLIPALVRDARDAFDAGRTRPLAFRLDQLHAAVRMMRERERDIVEALHADLGKPELEAFGAEVAFTISEAEYLIKRLPRLMKPRRVATPIVTQPGRSLLYKEPLGVVLIIAPWNYPFQLAIGPLLGAIAAGNAAVVKPSEVAPAVSALIATLLPKYLDPACFKVVQGGVLETTTLLDERFDHIFYTGNGTVGRIVMAAAAKHLTPVTLELGGKSPVYVDPSADLDVTARRIAWGKFYNAGQTCVAPDYVLAHESIHDALLAKIDATLKAFYGSDPKLSPDYGRIVNERHHRRVSKLLKSGDVVSGGQTDESTRYIAPTVLKNVSPDSPVMAEEIFGPVLPVLKVKSADDAIRFINARPKPLALYVFSSSSTVTDAFVERTSSGGLTVNHAWLHLTCPDLPFGGVGESGMGAYHGKGSFETFTHTKPVLKKPLMLDPPIMYPPYTEAKAKWLRRLL